MAHYRRHYHIFKRKPFSLGLILMPIECFCQEFGQVDSFWSDLWINNLCFYSIGYTITA